MHFIQLTQISFSKRDADVFIFNVIAPTRKLEQYIKVGMGND